MKKDTNNLKITLSAIFLCLFLFNIAQMKADVVYSIPLQGQEHHIGNMLEWGTSFESNSQMFIVEKSIDGIDYMNTGVIDAAGSSKDDKGYRFLDVGVNDKKTYYRLKQIDADGTSSYSQTILVKKEMTNNFMVVAMSSTVTNKDFEVTVDVLGKTEMETKVKNKKGEIISEKRHQLEFGLNNVNFNLEDEKEGVYIITLKVKDEKEMLVIHKVDDEIKKKPNVASKKQNNGG